MSTVGKVAVVVACVILGGLLWYVTYLKSELASAQRENVLLQESLHQVQLQHEATEKAYEERDRILRETEDNAKKKDEMLQLIPESWGDTVLPDSLRGLFANDTDAGDTPGTANGTVR